MGALKGISLFTCNKRLSKVQCLVSGQWSDVYLVLRTAVVLDMFSGAGIEQLIRNQFTIR